MKKYNVEKGITLIALVITIIVLLILAGVTIAMVVGDNGILSRSREAKEKTAEAQAREEVYVEWSGLNIDEGFTNLTLEEQGNKLVEALTSKDSEVSLVGVDEENLTITVHYKGYDIEVNTREVGTEIAVDGFYKVVFHTNGGSNIDTQTVKAGEKAKMVSDPEKDGAYFDGWYSDNGLNAEYNFETSVNSDIDLYAKWVEETPVGLFTWETTESSAAVTGFSAEGTSKYEAGELTTLAFPRKYNNLNVIGIKRQAFSGKSKLEKVIIPNSLTDVSDFAFHNCIEITSLTLPISTTLNVGSAPSFSSCTGITKVKLTKGTGEGIDYTSNTSNSYKCLPWYYSRTNEMTIELEEGITKIGSYTFYDTTGIEKINIPTTVSDIGNSAFYGLRNWKQNDLDISNVKSIGMSAFGGCSSLTGKLIFSNEINTIPDGAFTNCKSLNEITINDNITDIGGYTFSSCSGITNLTLPISTTLNVDSAPSFSSCTGITKVKLTKGTGEGIDYTSNTSNSYKCLPWYYSRTNEMTIELEEGITKIGSYTFYDTTGIEKINIPTTVSDIGNSAFYGLRNWKQNDLDISNVKSIGMSAFGGCSSLTGKLIFSNEINTIPDRAFTNCKSLNEIIINDNITNIGGHTFSNCSGVTNLTLPISITLNVSNAPSFAGCTGITKVKLTKGQTGEGIDYTSKNYNGLPWYYSRANEMTIELEEGITKIGNYMFYGTTGIKTITLPSTIQSIGNNAFSGCTGLTTINYKGNESSWGNIEKGTGNDVLSSEKIHYN